MEFIDKKKIAEYLKPHILKLSIPVKELNQAPASPKTVFDCAGSTPLIYKTAHVPS